MDTAGMVSDATRHTIQPTVEVEKMARKSTTKSAVATRSAAALNEAALQQQIAQKAYERYLDRGQIDGYDKEDWLAAEQLVLAELGEKPVGGREETIIGSQDNLVKEEEPRHGDRKNQSAARTERSRGEAVIRADSR
jgi:Protein of unknown function (DUF2934)